MLSRLTLVILLCSSLGASGCAYSMIRSGQLRREPFDAVVARTAAARGIEPQLPIDARVIEASELEAVMRRAIAHEWSDDQIRRYTQAHTAMGLWPAGRDLLDEVVAVMEEEVAGLYDPSERALYIVSDVEIPVRARLLSALLRRDLDREIVLAHELVHLLQHERYPSLVGADPFFYQHDDAAAAIQAAIEGDATRYGFEALGLVDELPDPLDFSDEIDVAVAFDPDSESALARSPALIRLTLTFPYAHGYRLAHAEGRALLDSPPASTEQVLHPDDRRSPFLAIDLSALRDVLPAGCHFVRENTLGERDLSVLFRDLAEQPSRDAWVGWDGDRYVVADCDERPAILWLTAWDSRSDALEFESAYRDILPTLVAHAGLATPPTIRRNEREVLVYSDALAPLAESVASRMRRERVSSVAELRSHFDAGAGPSQARSE